MWVDILAIMIVLSAVGIVVIELLAGFMFHD